MPVHPHTSLSPAPLRIESHAKINWFLTIGNRRGDGYHDLDSLMQRVALGDMLGFQPLDQDSVELDDRGGCGCTPDKNIIVKAAQRLKAACNCPRGVRITIDKHIPVSAGLGGGSANAAATLMSLVSLWSLDISPAALADIARTLGADVPFFLGPPAARCRGIGDILTPVEPRVYHLVLWNPGVPLSTADVYAAFDAAPRPQRSIDAFLDVYASGSVDAVAHEVWNNLALASIERMPKLASMVRTCRDLGARAAWVTGSGPTVVGLCDTATAATALAKAIKSRAGVHHVIKPVATLTS